MRPKGDGKTHCVYAAHRRSAVYGRVSSGIPHSSLPLSNGPFPQAPSVHWSRRFPRCAGRTPHRRGGAQPSVRECRKRTKFIGTFWESSSVTGFFRSIGYSNRSFPHTLTLITSPTLSIMTNSNTETERVTTTTERTIVTERTTTTIERITSKDDDCYWTSPNTDIFAEFRKIQGEDLQATMAPTIAKAEAAIAASRLARTTKIPAVVEGYELLRKGRLAPKQW